MKKATALSLLAVGLTAGWLGFRSDYEFTTYPVDGCAQPVTAVTYWKVFHRGRWFSRGVALVPGAYRTEEIPSRDCLILPKLSGFDAYFEAVLTCENGTIVITSPSVLESPIPSTAIVSRRVDNGNYADLRAASGRNLIELH